eukprot:CAMPEP_0119046408 /NCGR_PEP_ID=MMETSP1177-20130426/46402_1 /TAXON_ID=2985 /ORGANISM="Ochromonas sp, Strain CCMP1899" /LENGTH=162 /DNA_ID=CAMNT_0007019507 /DNA_START=189 /DNA_END=674 /DNA_ORIENTATION=+
MSTDLTLTEESNTHPTQEYGIELTTDLAVPEKTVGTIDDIFQKEWEERANAQETVRKKLRTGWRNDDKVLEQYFHGCVSNWKAYTGARKPNTVKKLQAVYKQAIYGDCNTDLSKKGVINEEIEAELSKWTAWNKLKGMDTQMAKRRFITLLTEIDPLLIEVT